MAPQPARPPRPGRHSLRLALLLVLCAATFAVYSPVLRHQFLNYDDDLYITRNPGLRLGLTREGVAWAFTTGYGANWFPLTWLSWMLDHSLFGPSPRGFHLTNLLLHVLSTGLLFLVLARMTGTVGRSAFVAGVFALHPLHVESVAWAATRKDVLSGLFWMLTIGAYVRYVQAPSLARYVPVFACLALGLMAKPMLVTLPFVLLLLDFWPLARLGSGGHLEPGRLRTAVLEKLPLLALVAASSVVTYVVQRAGGAVEAGQVFPLPIRIGNALVSYMTYLRKAVWPSDLAVFYPHPGLALSTSAALSALIALAALSAVLLGAARRQPYLGVGWLWFLGTLVPVIGLVQVGQQAMADRYTYLPLIGVSLGVAWGLIAPLARLGRPVPAVMACVTLTALAFLTAKQVRVWHDSLSLFEHSLRVTPENPVAHLNLGGALLEKGRLREAETHLREGVRLHPGSAEGHGMMGEVLARTGREEEARAHFATALRLDPRLSRVRNAYARFLADHGEAGQALVHLREAIALDSAYAEPYNNLGSLLLSQGRAGEAIEYFRKAVALDPGYAEAHNNWGVVLLNRGQLDEAAERFRVAATLKPALADAYGNWGLVLLRQGDLERAVARLREAVALDAAHVEARKALGLAMARRGEYAEAIAHFQAAASLGPDDPELENSWGMALAALGDSASAVSHYERALALQPGYADAHNSLGIALGEQGRLSEAIAHFRRAAALRPDYALAYNNWGLALARQGKLPEAIARFREAVARDAGYADGHNNLGVFLARLGRLDEAAEHFREAVRLDPGRADARVNLDRLLATIARPAGSR